MQLLALFCVGSLTAITLTLMIQEPHEGDGWLVAIGTACAVFLFYYLT